MIIIGVDFHPEFQQIAWVDTDSGEIEERRLQHPEEAVAFYRGLASQGKTVRVGMEASGYARWFEGLLSELQLELWIGDAAEIRTKRVRKQKQGSSIMRFLLVEAAQVSARSLPEWRSKYFHLTMRRGRKIAKVAMARQLAVRLFWMMRQGWDYQQWVKFGSHAI